MIRIDKMIYKICIVSAVVFLTHCNKLYKAGNLIALQYPIETSLRSDIIEKYLDTLIKQKGYEVPQKWIHYNKLIDLDSVNNKRIYFKNNPEEMYLLSFSGMPVLADLFNPSIKESDWVSERKLITKEQEKRIMERLKKEVLDPIEAMAMRDKLADSTIYKQ